MSNNGGDRGAHRALKQRSRADKMNEHREALRAMLSEKDSKLQKDQNGVVHLGKPQMLRMVYQHVPVLLERKTVHGMSHGLRSGQTSLWVHSLCNAFSPCGILH